MDPKWPCPKLSNQLGRAPTGMGISQNMVGIPHLPVQQTLAMETGRSGLQAWVGTQIYPSSKPWPHSGQRSTRSPGLSV